MPEGPALSDPRGHSRARRLGYSLLPGQGFSYVLHLRPREWPIVVAHVSVGYVLAVGGPGADWRHWASTLGVALLLWVICLNGGTLALNSAFDRDIGDIGYLDAPPPPPPGLLWVGLALMLAGQVAAFAMPRGFAVAYATCVVMSVLYSVPPVRLKAVAGADWIINMIGFGALTVYAGWAVTGRPLTAAMAWITIGFMLLFAALYPLTQLYQMEEDAGRGDRTLVLVLGPRASLVAAIGAAVAASACFALAARSAALSATRWLPMAAAAAIWIGFLLNWYRRRETMRTEEQRRGMYLALGIWALTDAAMLWGFAGAR